MEYRKILTDSATEVQNVVCIGLDPILEALPFQGGDFYDNALKSFEALFSMMEDRNLRPSAFKPNIGYWQIHDRPLAGAFRGSLALAEVLKMVRSRFVGAPIILDSKRGDIATSSHNYAFEAFEVWEADAVTVAPYMGSDSVSPFIEFGDGGLYVLNRTSNPGGKDLQNLILEDGSPLYDTVAKQIVAYNSSRGNVGAVVGATNLEELQAIATRYRDEAVPLLIPGVGSQGGSASEVMAILRSVGYSLPLVRINSSSGITHPWKQGPAPADWLERSAVNLAQLIEEAAL